MDSKYVECVTCGDFVEKQLIKKHTHYHHHSTPELECDLCRSTSSSSSKTQPTSSKSLGSILDIKDLRFHFPFHHVPTLVKNFECDECPKTFNRKSNLREHMREHGKEFLSFEASKKKKNLEMCPICKKLSTNLPKHHVSAHLTGRKFKCKQCDKGFMSKPHLIRHQEDVHEKIKPHKCVFVGCDQAYHEKYRLRRHMATHTEQDVIDFCNKELEGDQDLSEGEEEEISSDEEPEVTEMKLPTMKSGKFTLETFKTTPMRCPICETVTVDLPRHHASVHFGIGRFECDQCDKRFSRKEYIRRHKMFVHDQIKRHKLHKLHKCVFEGCNKTFRQKFCLTRHMVTHISIHDCKICSLAFSTWDQLKKHTIEVHPNDKSYVCDFCPSGRVYKELSCFKKHLVLHNDHFPLEEDVDVYCDIDSNEDDQDSSGDEKETQEEVDDDMMLKPEPKQDVPIESKDKFSNKAEVTLEPAKTNAKNFKLTCNLCGKAFRFLTSFRTHMAQLHQQVGDLNPKYKKRRICPICRKAVVHLTRHLADVHLGTKNFKCEKCDKSYSRRARLDQHNAWHDKINDHKCVVEGCDKAFNRKDKLKRHMEKHTEEINLEDKKYVCNFCPYKRVFTQLISFKKHLALHTDQFPLQENVDGYYEIDLKIDQDFNEEDQTFEDANDEKDTSEGREKFKSLDDELMTMLEPNDNVSVEIKAEVSSDEEPEIIRMEPPSLMEVKAEPEELPVTTFVVPVEIPDFEVKTEPEIVIFDDSRLQVMQQQESKTSAKVPGSSIDVSTDSAFQMLNCTECGRIFHSKTMLERHFALFHEKPVDHQCPKCPKTFELKFDLDRHCEKSHSQQKH